MSNDLGGVWRTIGGRRVFIKTGQDLSSAMKESGKFKTGKKNRSNFYQELNNSDKKKYDEYLKQGYSESDIENTLMVKTTEEMMRENGIEFASDELPPLQQKANEVVDKIEQDYIKNKQEEMTRNQRMKEFTDNANKINEESKNRAIESEKTFDESKRYNTNEQGKAIKFNENDGLYSERLRKFAEEDTKQIENLGTYVLNEYKAGRMTYEKANLALDYGYGVQGQEGIKACNGFDNIRNREYYKDDLYGTKAKEKMDKQISYYYKQLDDSKANSNDWIKDAFNQYKKDHPNSKMTLQNFMKNNK